jgi:hypothetical protein
MPERDLERTVIRLLPQCMPFASLQHGNNGAVIVHPELEELGQEGLFSHLEHNVGSGCF